MMVIAAGKINLAAASKMSMRVACKIVISFLLEWFALLFVLIFPTFSVEC